MPLSVSCAAGGRIGAGLFVALGWCWRVDSNHRPTDYESVALPAELRQPASRARRVSPDYISALCVSLSGLRARADDDVHPVGDRALRQSRQPDDADVVGLPALPQGTVADGVDIIIRTRPQS